MKCFLVLAVLSGCLAISTDRLDREWANFKLKYNKQYSAAEDQFRYKIFKKNFHKIEVHNNLYGHGKLNFLMGINKFADLSNEEFQAQYLMKFENLESISTDNVHKPSPKFVAPDHLDWRDKHAVGPVLDQELCGTCWAFSATAALEGQDMLKNGRLLGLSQQQLIDCSTPYGNHGCDGGLPSFSFEYVIDKGITSARNYPYTCHFICNGTCVDKKYPSVLNISGYKSIKAGENNLRDACAEVGPISVLFDAKDIDAYKQGIIKHTGCSQDKPNHAVILIGYGTEDGTDYWLLRNSWGVGWGEEGFFRLARNQNNLCGIASTANYPEVLPHSL